MEKADYSLLEIINQRHKEKKFFTNTELENMVTQIVGILAKLKNDLKIMHRDIKPPNILYINH